MIRGACPIKMAEWKLSVKAPVFQVDDTLEEDLPPPPEDFIASDSINIKPSREDQDLTSVNLEVILFKCSIARELEKQQTITFCSVSMSEGRACKFRKCALVTIL